MCLKYRSINPLSLFVLNKSCEIKQCTLFPSFYPVSAKVNDQYLSCLFNMYGYLEPRTICSRDLVVIACRTMELEDQGRIPDLHYLYIVFFFFFFFSIIILNDLYSYK